MHKKVISILLTAALVGGLLTIGATSALANHTGDGPPPASLLPDDDGVGGLVGTALSDRDDGTDSAAHLTAIAPSFTDQVEWRRCPTTVAPPIDNADITACSAVLGTDTEGVPLGEGGGFPPVTPDLAFDLKYDITAADEANSPADVITLACAGAARTVANCVVVLDEGISFDDASSGLPGTATTSAEMASICTADIDGGPNAGATNVCQVGGAGAGTPAQVAARFVAWDHGDPVPNDGFVVRVTTSPDLNVAGTLEAYRDWTGIGAATGESDGSDTGDVPCTLLDANAARAIWECAFADAGAADDDAVQEVGVFDEAGSGQGLCAGATPCKLDAHGTASQARAAETVSAYFVPGTGDLEAVSADSTCETPDQADANSLGSASQFRGCVQDQFGQPFSPSQVTAEFNPDDVGAISGGTCTDRNTDGETDHCERVAATSSTATFDEFQFTLTNVLAEGTQTVVFCPDEDDNGCDDEALTATVVKDWEAVPDTVFLTFDGTATNTDTLFDTCTSGDTFAENRTGDRDNLLACTFDAVGLPNPVPASTDKPGGGRLQWFITPSGGGELTATRFAENPPRETGPEPDSTAIATLEAFRGGNDVIRVELQDELGNLLDDAEVQKRVTQTQRPTVRVDSAVSIRGRFRGRVTSARARCVRGRLVKVKKVRPGRDRTIGQDRTNRRGRYVVRRRGATGRFYAKVVKKRIVRPNRIIVCRAARSNTVRRR